MTYSGLSVSETLRDIPTTDLISSNSFSCFSGFRAKRRNAHVNVVLVVSAPAANKSSRSTRRVNSIYKGNLTLKLRIHTKNYVY